MSSSRSKSPWWTSARARSSSYFRAGANSGAGRFWHFVKAQFCPLPPGGAPWWRAGIAGVEGLRRRPRETRRRSRELRSAGAARSRGAPLRG
jgi:hypothetical protein